MAATVYPGARTLRELVAYSPRTGVFRWRWRARHWFKRDGTMKGWNKRFAGQIIGRQALRCMCVNNQTTLVRAQVAWIIMTGRKSRRIIDHINGDTTDDRWHNLRQATKAQNAQNTAKNKPHDLPKGVWLQKGRYRAKIVAKGQRYYLGMFATAEEAHQAYCEAGHRLHGRFFERRNTR